MPAPQVLLKIHSLAAKAEQEGSIPDWSRIQRAVCRSKPPCKGMVQELCFFAQKNAGGQSGWALHHLADTYRSTALGTANRQVEGALFEALAQAEVEPPVPYLKNFMLLANYTAPAEFVKEGRCKFIGPSDCSLFKGKKQVVAQEAELMLREGLALASKVEAGAFDSDHRPDVNKFTVGRPKDGYMRFSALM